MSYSSGEAAEQVVRMTLNGVEVAAKISGKAAERLAVLLYAVLKDQKKTRGKTRLNSMLRSGKELKVFAIGDRDLEKFCREAKKYGILYCVLKDKTANDGHTDVFVRAEDASKINRIFDRFGIATADIGSARTEIVKAQEEQKNADIPVPDRSTTEKDKEEAFLDAFCCGVSIEELKKRGHSGALSWIEKFAEQRNGVGKPLPAVLKRTGLEWYELQDKEIAEVFTMMNPDQRLFFAKFETPSFVNQRLIGLTHKAEYPDEELNHALLNSMFTMFYIEASGFGRGLGVLDVNKDNIAKCYMLNPNLVSATDRQNILSAFEKLKARQIMKVSEELKDEIRLDFEHIVLQSFGMEDYFDKIKSSLLSMQETRAAARE